MCPLSRAGADRAGQLAHKGETNIMTMGWHMIMEFVPSLIGCTSGPRTTVSR
jgi:hypothetical protein